MTQNKIKFNMFAGWLGVKLENLDIAIDAFHDNGGDYNLAHAQLERLKHYGAAKVLSGIFRIHGSFDIAYKLFNKEMERVYGRITFSLFAKWLDISLMDLEFVAAAVRENGDMRSAQTILESYGEYNAANELERIYRKYGSLNGAYLMFKGAERN